MFAVSRHTHAHSLTHTYIHTHTYLLLDDKHEVVLVKDHVELGESGLVSDLLELRGVGCGVRCICVVCSVEW
jgi:hypothetical protein